MHLQRLELEEFRLYRHLSLPLDPLGLRIIGENATGKSTLVEAAALLATMRSPRTGSDRELINWQSGQEYGVAPYSRTVGTVETAEGQTHIEIGLQVDTATDGTLKKQVKVNGKPSRALDAVGNLRVVLFSPEDVGLITGPPSGRRRYLDLLLSQIDNRYVRSLARYNRILEQRNSLLKTLSKEARQVGGGTVTSQLAFWNDELLTYGSYLIARRSMVCAGLAQSGRTRFTEFSASGELSLGYSASVPIGIVADERLGDGEYVRSLAHRAFEQKLDDLRGDELRRGVSLVGPHRDDVSMLLNGMPVGTFGSRGQQRLAVLALKLAEADQMLIETTESPVILFDDVLSELDAKHRERLLEAVCAAGAQLIITSTDRDLLEFPFLERLPLMRAVPGSLEAMS